LVPQRWTLVAELFKGRIRPLGTKGGPGEDEDIGDERPQYAEELEDVFDGFGSHGGSEEGRKEALSLEVDSHSMMDAQESLDPNTDVTKDPSFFERERDRLRHSCHSVSSIKPTKFPQGLEERLSFDKRIFVDGSMMTTALLKPLLTEVSERSHGEESIDEIKSKSRIDCTVEGYLTTGAQVGLS
jgi:hypothetical protein